MVLKSEVVDYLRSLPANVHLLPYGNCLGRGSLLPDPPCPKEDYEKAADQFNLPRITEALEEIPRTFKRVKRYSAATSYGLKHVLERATGKYISNGDFICAMALSGFRVRFPRDTDRRAVNAVFNCEVRKAV